ncbi:MAG: DsbC family protein [Gammaproteobacteria bacterium]|nr:DsbC family protein [Rhodocyclaceae bacterium]MBU3909343.1 DsbC family protein [Gammaproteobacteria bacterium]MBU3988709.1 DsbC family protein [Gammaproteobacteria bacterium]MBU4005497.1 DsbC family protein [Gammaproteobacteria bacterium]MBU4020950.1 DsbC family protein [Gammaproteobacteria bacterium]
MKLNSRFALLSGLAALFLSQAAFANEAQVKKGVEAWLGSNGPKVESVRKAGALGLYEVMVDGELIYTDEKVTHLILGQIIEAQSRKNLTEERKQKLSQIKFSDLPLDLAIKQVKGNGKRLLATFEDPNCSYCKKLAQELQGVNDVTIYTFVYPILSPDSTEKAKNIWCASDRVKAWNDFMVNNQAPASKNCNHPTEKVVALGRKLNIRGTPTMFFADGSRVPGYMPMATLEKALDKGSADR